MSAAFAALKTRLANAVATGVGTRALFADRASNAELWDVEGVRHIDFAAGIAVNNTGHRHPAVMAAVEEQATRFIHTCFHVAPYESYIRLAERLNELVPTGRTTARCWRRPARRRSRTQSRSRGPVQGDPAS